MSESPDEKPVLRLTATIEIQSETHGLLRFRKWTLKDSTAIARLCEEELAPRTIAERLLAHQAADPLLTKEELEHWPDPELREVAVKWWQSVERGRSSPIVVDSLEAFQNAVRQHSAEDARRLNTSVRKVGGLASRITEPSAFERLTRDLAGQKSILDFTEHSAIQKAIEQMQFAQPFSVASAIRDIKFAMPERLAIESLHERMRDMQLLSAPRAIDFSKLATAANPLLARMTETEKMVRQMSERFRAYETAFDSNRIRDVLRVLDSSAYKRFAPNLAELESVAARFKTPWIDRLSPEASVTGIARMAALTAATHAHNPFDLSSVTAIREALGDWRDVKMPWRLLPDSNLREQFYIDRGFDTSLIQLPEPAFTQALENVGLVRPLVPPVEADFEEIDEEENLRQRMSHVYELLFHLERALRAYIDRVMTEKYGPDWERHRCYGNGKVYQQWVEKRDKAVQSGLKPKRLIQYADFTEYAGLITKADNWEEVFKGAFGRPESVRESFHRLGPVRLCTMHARPITKTEIMLASAEITRLLIAIGDTAKDNGE
jgi:hypothetical protein